MEKRKRRICHPHYARCLHEKYTLMIDFRRFEAADSEFAVENLHAFEVMEGSNLHFSIPL